MRLLGRDSKLKLLAVLLWAGCLGIRAFPLHAQDGASSPLRLFEKGRLSVQVAGGFLKGPIFVKTQRPEFALYRANFRLGWILSHPANPRCFFEGNFEGLLEITYSSVNQKLHGYFGGGGILLRYNILSIQDKGVIPYFQAGAGIVRNNIYKDPNQGMIGSPTEFTLRSGVGIRFLIADRWSLDLEGVLEHISNAGLSDRNQGMNAIGFLVGITHYF